MEKCAFNVRKVDFLGFILSSEGITMNEQMMKAVIDWRSPTSVKKFQSFIGFANFYRRFIKEISQKVIPLTQLLRKGVPLVWSTEAEESFQALKKSFTYAPILLHADPSEPFYLETDASDLAVGEILS
ncbi:uncharacterized protein [Pleurodeles waltl]|uniref:uncharacterized protein n=1 Tax=Pleurodeles waltl TaxID=8319 RepID=UPI0037097CF5